LLTNLEFPLPAILKFLLKSHFKKAKSDGKKGKITPLAMDIVCGVVTSNFF